MVQEKITEQAIREAISGEDGIICYTTAKELEEKGWVFNDDTDRFFKDQLRSYKDGYTDEKPDYSAIHERVLNQDWEVHIDSDTIKDGPNSASPLRDSGERLDGIEDVIKIWKEGKGQIEIL